VLVYLVEQRFAEIFILKALIYVMLFR